jgi:NhaD family Na+/H+ antiporter
MTNTLDAYAIWMIVVFILGYLLISMEHIVKINKATVALMMGAVCWAIQFVNQATPCSGNIKCLEEHISNISQVIFFLLGALAIVEIINVHKGFSIISDCMNIHSKRKLLWVIGFLTFFLSAVLDNLTTTIVMVSLLRKLVARSEDRLLIGSGIVIAANAGGAWTPIGDVTTTMLWIGGQVSSAYIMRDLLFPSVLSMVVSFVLISLMLKGDFETKAISFEEKRIEPMGEFLFFLGIGILVCVPIFKLFTGLPPFMGILFGLAIMWLVTDIIHCKYEERLHLRVPYVLARIDLSGVLFFLGILLAIDALDSAKILKSLAEWLDRTVANTKLIAVFIGLASAVIDNVPLVAATMGMYDMAQYPQDHDFWKLVAFCAGTGGSILIIGSAAGVVFMGMEKVDFFWYFKRVSLSALIGYLVGVGVYIWQSSYLIG